MGGWIASNISNNQEDNFPNIVSPFCDGVQSLLSYTTGGAAAVSTAIESEKLTSTLISLVKEHRDIYAKYFGKLIDYFNGDKDICKRKISFKEIQKLKDGNGFDYKNICNKQTTRKLLNEIEIKVLPSFRTLQHDIIYLGKGVGNFVQAFYQMKPEDKLYYGTEYLESCLFLIAVNKHLLEALNQEMAIIGQVYKFFNDN